MYNISQYANYAISNATGEPTDCIPAGKCQEMTCTVGDTYSSLNFIIRVCDIPQIVKTVVTDPDGTVTAISEIQNFDSLTWNINSQNITVNVNLRHPNPSTLGFQVSHVLCMATFYPSLIKRGNRGYDSCSLHFLSLQVTFDCDNCSGPVTMIPPVLIPLNITGCNISPPNYTNTSLVTPCDITPLIARLTFTPPGFPSIMCASSAPPDCYTITCSVPQTRDSVSFKVNPCLYNPPAVTVVTYMNSTVRFNKTSSKQIDFTLGSSQVPMRMTLVQHSQKLSIGFKVKRCLHCIV